MAGPAVADDSDEQRDGDRPGAYRRRRNPEPGESTRRRTGLHEVRTRQPDNSEHRRCGRSDRVHRNDTAADVPTAPSHPRHHRRDPRPALTQLVDDGGKPWCYLSGCRTGRRWWSHPSERVAGTSLRCLRRCGPSSSGSPSGSTATAGGPPPRRSGGCPRSWTLPALAVAGGAGIASLNPDVVLVGSLMLLATPVLAFVPVRRAKRRWRLTRRWAAHRIPRSTVGPRWQSALDALAAAERSLRIAGLHEPAGTAADALGLALDRAGAGTRVDAELTRITAAANAGDPADPDVRVLRSDLLQAAESRNALIAANVAAADRLTHLAATAGSAAAAGAAAVNAVRERALGGLGDAVARADALRPRDPNIP